MEDFISGVFDVYIGKIIPQGFAKNSHFCRAMSMRFLKPISGEGNLLAACPGGSRGMSVSLGCLDGF